MRVLRVTSKDDLLIQESARQNPVANSRRSRMRFATLILVLIFEIAFVLILRIAGWIGTTVSLAGFASLLPIIVGLVFIFHRGRVFSIRSLLIATACFSGFIVITLQPLLTAQLARQVRIAFREADIYVHRPGDLVSVFKIYHRETQDIVENDQRDRDRST